ncbi:MAG: hypothetical protein GC202_13450 [Alphaproteobacteria bacterium]|nr:hypothetical protein [Alphaproteobacteria bacterium]
MKPRHRADFNAICDLLRSFSRDIRQLPGIAEERRLGSLACQIIDSQRRIKFVRNISAARNRISPDRVDPSSSLFDPLKGAAYEARLGNIDEAVWLVFLATHFGKHPIDGWRLCRDIYGKLGQGGGWNWPVVSQNPNEFRNWLAANQAILRAGEISRRFSNHRKYESLSAESENGTAAVLESFILWVNPPRTFAQLINQAQSQVGQNPVEVFHFLYDSMKVVRRFGRLARFDFLTMLDKLDLAPISAGSAYLDGATGPIRGAKLMFFGDRNAKCSPRKLQSFLDEIDLHLNIGMQAWEDSLCNWQKSPDKYKLFRG